MKKKRINKVINNIITVCLIGIIAVSGFNIGKIIKGYLDGRSGYKKISKKANIDPNQFTGVIDFDKLKAVNDEIAGWIYLKDTNINYPVMHAGDNDKYLHTMPSGDYNGAGSLFADHRNKPDFSDFNTIIYGHHMKDRTMFADIDKYKDQDFYNGHKNMEFITPQGRYHLEIISYYQTLATGDSYKIDFYSENDKKEFISNTLNQSLIKTAVTPDSSNRFLTLSTCVNATGDERYVVIGRLVPWTKEENLKAEELQAKIDKSK